MFDVYSTFALARALGGGAILSGINTRYEVSDYSPSTGEVYGWPIEAGSWAGIPGQRVRGAYQRLPDDLAEPMPDNAALMAARPAGAEDYWRVIGAARHAVFYGEMVTDADKAAVLRMIGADRIAASTDPHLNDIPLGLWDGIAAARAHAHAPLMKARGTWLSQSTGVCIVKAAARAIIADRAAATVEA